ncbi:hypothetical protein HDU79_006132 [Rhizoclosmatium sp. JEL0117]|nr:hypothetical protein HDU79_006132 [Rhizoclosmatium sp. JEL0117]
MKLVGILATLATLSLALRPNKPLNKALVAPATKAPPSPITLPTTAQFQSVVNPLVAKVDVNQVSSWLTKLTQFPDRYYQSQNGVAAANWILSTVQALPVPSGAKLTVSLYKHANFIQPSVIARYESATPTNLQGIVVTGSHFDTLAGGSPQGDGGPNPAADDCASGSAAVFESLRILTSQGFIPGRPIEFHWYAAEEEGLYGSTDIANAYAAKGVQVVSYLNLDQSGYVKAGTTPEIGIFVDYTTKAATTLLTSTVAAYAGLPQIGNQVCGYQCTDNASWYNAGYNSAMAFESANTNAFPYNDQVNSDGSPLDTLDKVSMPHVAAFAKSTIGFIVELSLAGSGTTVQTTTAAAKTTTTAGGVKTTTAVAKTTTAATACAHSKCVTGVALRSSCDTCVGQIIAQDSYCGSTSWDSTCVGEVKSICGITC